MFSGRFKEVEVNNKKLLVDVDTSKLAWIIPWAVWLFPKNAYHYRSLKTDKKQKKKNSSKGLIVLTSSILASGLINQLLKVCVGIFISIVALYFFGSIFIFKGNILGLGVYYFFLINILFRNYSEKIPEAAKFSLKK